MHPLEDELLRLFLDSAQLRQTTGVRNDGDNLDDDAMPRPPQECHELCDVFVLLRVEVAQVRFDLLLVRPTIFRVLSSLAPHFERVATVPPAHSKDLTLSRQDIPMGLPALFASNSEQGPPIKVTQDTPERILKRSLALKKLQAPKQGIAVAAGGPTPAQKSFLCWEWGGVFVRRFQGRGAGDRSRLGSPWPSKS